MITVAKDNSGDFDSIQKAVDSVSDNNRETIFIKKGIYKERIEIRKNNITLIGEDTDETIITEGFYARMIMPDGSKRGTFRSYTFLVYADNFSASNITFENSAGFGDNVGQAIAVYAEGDNITFNHCKILGHQDTLFTGPLPLKEKQPGGFTGPTIDGERKLVHQLYEDCFICGEIDFIFGSATAYFKNCTLFALNRNEPINSYYTAPSTYEGQAFGYVFDNCTFTGNCPPKSVALSRPWRIHAKVVLLNCEYSDQIIDEGFTDWNKPESHETVYYAEYNGHGDGYKPEKRAAYVHQLDEAQAARYTLENVMKS
ncbi:pectinesterase family protein [Lachnospira eligens]|uniref:pectinesterase family protein n=1 Tax=Lachnospira eligens TaxID=39485 RepID=UPI001899E84E|nr:pectinesterase family protein [Lachnospira eligens]